jgi:hypothetical protein
MVWPLRPPEYLITGTTLIPGWRGARNFTCIPESRSPTRRLFLQRRWVRPPAVATTDKIKRSAAKPGFVPGPTLRAEKQYLSCLSLPDGSLLEVGGGLTNKIENARPEASVLRSIGSTWSGLNPVPAGNHRLYHSSAFLLDDDRVVSVGSDPSGQPRSESVLVLSPPYLYQGRRPVTTSAPAVVRRSSTIAVRTTGHATRLTITNAPSPTHGMDSGWTPATATCPSPSATPGRPDGCVGPLPATRSLSDLGGQPPRRGLQGEVDLRLRSDDRLRLLPLRYGSGPSGRVHARSSDDRQTCPRMARTVRTSTDRGKVGRPA